jgi:hypothetical protein
MTMYGIGGVPVCDRCLWADRWRPLNQEGDHSGTCAECWQDREDQIREEAERGDEDAQGLLISLKGCCRCKGSGKVSPVRWRVERYFQYAMCDMCYNNEKNPESRW